MRLLLTAALLSGACANASTLSVADYIRAAFGTTAGTATSDSTTTTRTNGTRWTTSGSTTTSSTNGTTTTEPCAQVSILSASSNSTSTKVPADVALACLRSVPLDKEGDALQLEGVAQFVQFQSTLTYLKDPPPGYLYPAVDIEAGLAELSTNLQNDVYTNEYDFQLDLHNLIGSAYDGHFSYWQDILVVFGFNRALNLYSVSTDGTALPNLYLSSDISAVAGANYSVSNVVKINGLDAETFLNEEATAQGNAQDPDANYNAMFPVVPLVVNGQSSNAPLFGSGTKYQGTDTVVELANGTIRHIDTYAATVKDFTGVTDGASFFDTFCTGPPSTTSSGSESSSSSPPQVSYAPVPSETALPGPKHYPDPWVIAEDYTIAGYLPESNPELAVLSIPSFFPADNIEFMDVARALLATAVAQNKTKLVIDLRGNGGGNVNRGYDLFKELFPQLPLYVATNFRANPLFNWTGEVASEYYSNVTNANATDADIEGDYTTIFNINSGAMVTPNLTGFSSWSDFFGPHLVHGDNFTSLNGYNFSDPFVDTDMGDPVVGYNNFTNIVTRQPFAPGDIVIVQDGQCASTCTVFTELMKSQAGVRQVAFGGRRQHGPMQGVGSVKGANDYTWSTIQALVGGAQEIATLAQQVEFNETFGVDISITTSQAILRAALGSTGEPNAGVNVRNNIRQGDESLTPLQFVYEAADCRLFYTASMIEDQALVWAAASNALWGDGYCVAGSTGQPSALNGTSYILSAPPAGANNTFGANETSVLPTDLPNAVPVASSSATATATGTSVSSAAGSASQSVTPYTGGAEALSSGPGGLVSLLSVLLGWAMIML